MRMMRRGSNARSASGDSSWERMRNMLWKMAMRTASAMGGLSRAVLLARQLPHGSVRSESFRRLFARFERNLARTHEVSFPFPVHVIPLTSCLAHGIPLLPDDAHRLQGAIIPRCP